MQSRHLVGHNKALKRNTGACSKEEQPQKLLPSFTSRWRTSACTEPAYWRQVRPTKHTARQDLPNHHCKSSIKLLPRQANTVIEMEELKPQSFLTGKPPERTVVLALSRNILRGSHFRSRLISVQLAISLKPGARRCDGRTLKVSGRVKGRMFRARRRVLQMLSQQAEIPELAHLVHS